MIAERVLTRGGRSVVIADDDLLAFANALRGDLLQPGDPGYEEARKVWNGMIDKRPALIARCAGTSDVVEAVNFARRHDLLVAVRGAGHNVAGNAVNDGGLMIDLAPMKGVRVDPANRVAYVQPGCNWGDVDSETQRHGLVTPGGQVSSTGVSGFTLGGGMGYVRRKWGLALDNLVAAEVVTAGGEIVTASETEHPALFWGIRGGGGNFGIVTPFTFRLHPLGPEVYAALTIYPIEQTGQVIRKWRDYVLTAPDEVTCDLFIWGMLPSPDVPVEMHWTPVVIMAAMYAGPVEEGERALQPARELGTPLADLSGVHRYLDIQSMTTPVLPNGQRYYWKSLTFDRLDEDIVERIADLTMDRPNTQTLLALRHLGGAMGRVPEDATAYGFRSAEFNFSVDATWNDPTLDDEMIAWTRAAWSSLTEETGAGVYLNFAGFGEDNDRLARMVYGSNYARLADVKRRYDPTNLFRGNINIAP
ncbi:MAG TPA: FAD-binding oxidoreductase [Thermomicrobiales bacterium]|nr:FAD-binding oxidoreductase [Thermomicrobiales bacterium]